MATILGCSKKGWPNDCLELPLGDLLGLKSFRTRLWIGVESGSQDGKPITFHFGGELD